MITYTLCCETYKTKQYDRVSYGIAAYAEDYPTCVARLRDIASDKNALDELVSLCNRLQLSPIHLYDVVEDFLAN